MKNAAAAWLASESMQYASSFNLQKLNAASHFISVDSVQIDNASSSAVAAGTVAVEHAESVKSGVHTDASGVSKPGTFISRVFAVFSTFGQRQSDQLIKKQHQMVGQEHGNDPSINIDSANAQSGKEDLERIKRYEYTGL